MTGTAFSSPMNYLSNSAIRSNRGKSSSSSSSSSSNRSNSDFQLTWYPFVQRHCRLGLTHCGLYKLVSKACDDGTRLHRRSTRQVYREVADAVEDHMYTCGEHLHDQELILLEALFSSYNDKAAREVPEMRLICWFGLMMDGFFGGSSFLPEPMPEPEYEPKYQYGRDFEYGREPLRRRR